MPDALAGADTPADPLLDRAIRLFTFLSRAQELKNPQISDLESYKREGAVHWLHEAPAHPAVQLCLRAGAPTGAEPALIVERLPRPPAPEPASAEHRAWLATPFDDPATEPRLRDHIEVAEDAGGMPEAATSAPTRRVALTERPEVVEAHEEYLVAWRAWAEEVHRDEPVRTFYGALFSTYVTANSHPEELELVVGTSLLAWQPADHPRSRRHLLTSPARIVLDEQSGRLSVLPEEGASQDRLSVELDMLSPSLITQPDRINQVRERARAEAAHPLDREAMADLGRRLVHLLSADAEYRDDDAPDAAVTSVPVATFAPALVLRRRSKQGLVEIFRTMISQMSASGTVPAGIRPLLDPDHVPPAEPEGESGDGALVRVDGDPFLPLHVNDRQLQILRRVDSTAQTVIQGPPGTGKTHTAAVLISHLLAQGKRVLVTAQTDRALKEVRGKLPEAIRPLAVSVVGTSREDMSDLRVAIERIAATAADHDPQQARSTIHRCISEIDSLRRRRASLYQQLREAREREVRHHDVHGYSGTLAAIAARRREQEPELGWIAEYTGDVVADPPLGGAGRGSDGPAPSGAAGEHRSERQRARSGAGRGSDGPALSDAEIAEWRALLLDEALCADEPDARDVLIPLRELPEPTRFAELVAAEKRSAEEAERYRHLQEHPAYARLRALSLERRAEVRARVDEVAAEIRDLVRRPERWVHEALADLRGGRLSTWTTRKAEITQRAAEAREMVAALPFDVRLTGDDPGLLVPAAEGLREHLAKGKKIKLGSDGLPKLGALTAKAVKAAESFFQRVRVNGLVPTSVEHVDAFLTWVRADQMLGALDRAWPSTTSIPAEDTLPERLQWHLTELELLDRVVALGSAVATLSGYLRSAGLDTCDWFDLRALDAYCAVPEAVRTADEAAAASAPLDALHRLVADGVRCAGSAPILQRVLEAVQRRLDLPYTAAHQRLVRLHEVRALVERREHLRSRLADAAPRLVDAIEADPAAPHWDVWLPRFGDAWAWAAAGTWLRERESADVNALQAAVNDVEDALRRTVEELAATRAWDHAVAPERLTRRSRAFLEQYASLVRRFGKGTGQHREQRKAEIRGALDRCRGAVPIWIMPIYRIAEQLRVEPGMFDVVIVDEASQAGLEATFLQYLAPKIVVIGDDKQVSPSAVGMDEQELRDLANQYLYDDDDFRATWLDPRRSLFDEAKMRFSGMLTLVEHRRCVPEIINFSNRIAYEPAGVRLVPVRQFGADRLEPIQTVFITDGYEKGSSTSRINPPEVDAVVEQIEKCLVDPRYDGLTMGVISLLGPAQAKAIEKQLLDRVSPDEWQARDLRCGDAASFQGSERDIMFLSMVAAPGPERRLTALTQDLYVQRYNVAVSRAKDQLWVFHSVDPVTLSNPEDMRFQLLDYCYGVRKRGTEDLAVPSVAPEDVRVPPFDSLFEQRVFNRIIDRGYTVVPQFSALGYSIDLVVVGAGTRLAVECDGDFWHGPEAHQRDMAHQRELERCGWHFFRVLESEFVLDPATTLARLWERLAELDIHPSGWVSTVIETTSDEATMAVPAALVPLVTPEQMRVTPESAGSAADADPPTEPIALSAVRTRLASERPGPDSEDEAAPHAVPADPPSRLEGGEDADSAVVDEEDHVDDRGGRERDHWVGRDDADPAESAPPIPADPAESAPPVPTDPAETKAPVHADPWQAPRSSRYQEFEGSTTPALAASRDELIDSLVEIVTTEGPVLGLRLHHVYIRASGQSRAGAQIQKALNSAISSAVRRGLLVQDDPLSEAGVKPKTFRRPDQPRALVRPSGPRTFEQIPPAELAAVMAEFGAELGWADPTAVFRATIGHYGLKQLGRSIRERLEKVARLVQSEP